MIAAGGKNPASVIKKSVLRGFYSGSALGLASVPGASRSWFRNRAFPGSVVIFPLIRQHRAVRLWMFVTGNFGPAADGGLGQAGPPGATTTFPQLESGCGIGIFLGHRPGPAILFAISLTSGGTAAWPPAPVTGWKRRQQNHGPEQGQCELPQYQIWALLGFFLAFLRGVIATLVGFVLGSPLGAVRQRAFSTARSWPAGYRSPPSSPGYGAIV